MIRRKQPPALCGDEVLGVLKLHWRATESRLAVQMRERGVQAVMLEHAAFMEALFQVNPSGVYNKTFLRDVVAQWCRFHSLPWTTTEIRQETFALKVLQITGLTHFSANGGWHSLVEDVTKHELSPSQCVGPLSNAQPPSLDKKDVSRGSSDGRQAFP